jgi:hypothetical protein
MDVKGHERILGRVSELLERAAERAETQACDGHKEAIVLDRSAPQKHVWRANIILATNRRLRHGRDYAPIGQIEAGGGAQHANRSFRPTSSLSPLP